LGRLVTRIRSASHCILYCLATMFLGLARIYCHSGFSLG
jgi:hypothetical protein